MLQCESLIKIFFYTISHLTKFFSLLDMQILVGITGEVDKVVNT